ncbi:MAG: hypothetical protein ABJA64_00560 [Candidatus Saccharibacteria bacterium]
MLAKRSDTAIVYQLDYRLDELFYPEELVDKMDIARRRVVTAFIEATEPIPFSRIKTSISAFSGLEHPRSRVRGTDNYIIGVGCRQKDLANYIVRTSKKPIVTRGDLPAEARRCGSRTQQRIIFEAEVRIVLALLNEMCQAPLSEIRYDEACGFWQIIQSSIDRHKMSLSAARFALKFDRRNEHGKVRAQRIARGIPAGLSTGQRQTQY